MSNYKWTALILAWITFAGNPASTSGPEAEPAEMPSSCPPVVREFLETIVRSSDLQTAALPIVVIDLQGHPLYCLVQTLPQQAHAETAFMLHETSMLRKRIGKPDDFSRVLGRSCSVGEEMITAGPFLGIIVSYDLAQMKSAPCLDRARLSLDQLPD